MDNKQKSETSGPFGQAAYNQPIDAESEMRVHSLDEFEKVKGNRVAGVRTVLVVLSSKAMAYDMESLRQKILLAYPEAAIFFRMTTGKSAGMDAPSKVDLLIDFTGPGQKQGWFYSRKLRRMSRVAVGRNAGLFRKSIYDRVFDEKVVSSNVPVELFERERFVQRKLLEMAGVAFVAMGDTPPDRSHSIALKLPSMTKMA